MRESLRQLAPYVTTKARGLPLHLNTNRLGVNPVIQRASQLLEKIDLSIYADRDAMPLRQALATHYDLGPEYFLAGNGSDEVFDLIFKTYLNPDETVAYPGPTYSMYRHYALTNGANAVEVPLDEAFDLKAQALVETKAKLLVLCTPNNPTGNTLHAQSIEKVLRSGQLVVIDEAYAEFGGHDWIRAVRDFPNLMVVRTFSKAYGLAGLRVGYVVANPKLIEPIELVRLPFNLNAFSQALAAEALREQEFVRAYTRLIREERPRWAEALTERGFHVWPSQANFLLVAMPDGVERDLFVAELETKGVLVRTLGEHPRLRECVRITVGTPDDRAILLKAIDEVLP
ncbi:histidinol-phosphate transaminase [Candidatus Acetothermia bacterium]|nr:histidinol-phosphate transaminase [Candidatus Acetothermia bacterium]